MDGILILNKPAGISSARAVACVKRLLPRKTKIGHAGTLDPFATGVLLLLVGKATKRCESLMDQPKQYDATVCLGATTDTDDPETPAIPWIQQLPTGKSAHPSSEDIVKILFQFEGQISQVPPVFSAMKVNGQRAYALARRGTPPLMVARPVMVYGLQLTGYSWPNLHLRVDCGRGTYIRSLARDIGAALNVGGHLTQLCRTRIGRFDIAAAKSLGDLSPDNVESVMVPITAIDSYKVTPSL